MQQERLFTSRSQRQLSTPGAAPGNSLVTESGRHARPVQPTTERHRAHGLDAPDMIQRATGPLPTAAPMAPPNPTAGNLFTPANADPLPDGPGPQASTSRRRAAKRAPSGVASAPNTARTSSGPQNTTRRRRGLDADRPRRSRPPRPLFLDPVEEEFLDGLARLAQRGDRLLRDRLYERFRPYLDRVCAVLARRAWVRLAELDDVRHENYILFCELLANWPGEESFAGFLFAHFARRLTVALRRFEGLRPRGPLVPPPTLEPTPEHEATEMAVFELLTGLAAGDRALLELLLAGHSLREAAARLGIAERTARRRLRRLRQRLRS